MAWRRLPLFPFPVAVLVVTVVTLRWDWGDQCASYGFPFPHTTWYGSSLEWEVAPLFLALDLLVHGAALVGVARAWRRWVPAPRWVTWALTLPPVLLGYAVLLVMWVVPAVAGLLHPRMEVFGGSLEAVAVELGDAEYCPNLDG